MWPREVDTYFGYGLWVLVNQTSNTMDLHLNCQLPKVIWLTLCMTGRSTTNWVRPATCPGRFKKRNKKRNQGPYSRECANMGFIPVDGNVAEVVCNVFPHLCIMKQEEA